MFQGLCAPVINRFSTVVVSCWMRCHGVVIAFSPSVGLITNFLVKTSQGSISKFIPCSLFFKINKFSHTVISLPPVTFFNHFGTGFNSWPLIKWCAATADFSKCLYLMFLKCSLIRVFKFLIVCPVYILSQSLQSTNDNSSRDRLKMGAHYPWNMSRKIQVSDI